MKLDNTRFEKNKIEETAEIELSSTELAAVYGGFCPEGNGFSEDGYGYGYGYGYSYGYGCNGGGFPYQGEPNYSGGFPYGYNGGFPYQGDPSYNGFPYGYGYNGGCNQ